MTFVDHYCQPFGKDEENGSRWLLGVLRVGGYGRRLPFYNPNLTFMENYIKGIIAEKTPEVSEAEDQPEAELMKRDQPEEREEPEEKLAPVNQDFFISYHEAGFGADQPIPIMPGLNPRTLAKIKAGAVVNKETWLSDHKFSRSDFIAADAERKCAAKWKKLKAEPAPQLVPLAEIFRPRQIVCEDEELLQIKERLSATNASKDHKQAAQLINYIRDSCARALVRRKEVGSYVHPEIRYAEFLRSQKESKYSPTKSIAMASTATMTVMKEDVKDLDEPSVADATHVVHDLILREEIREATARRSHQCTTDLADLQLETQPADVFQRMWTLVDAGNPIWKKYRVLINKHTTGFGKGRRQASACGNCMTIFYPEFPDDVHQHRKSEGFKTAIDGRVTSSNLEVALAADDDEEKQFRESTTYKALVALAKEAKAYKKETDADGVLREYIKMVRFVKGVRMVAGGTKYQQVEVCERCEVEGSIQEAVKQKYKVKALADGIIQLILR